MGTVRYVQAYEAADQAQADHTDASVVCLTLDAAPHNALTATMFDELERHIRVIEANPAVRAVVIHGAGAQLYTVGADMREMEAQAARADRRAAARAWLEPIHRVLDAIASSSKVYLCAM